MSIQTAYSIKPLAGAVQELKDRLQGSDPKVVLFFASTEYQPEELGRQMQSTFPGACVIGCSTAGEITHAGLLTGSVSAILLDADDVEDVAAVVVDNLGECPAVRDAFLQLEHHFQSPAGSWDLTQYAGIVLADGLSGAEEVLMEQVGAVTDVFFVGGSAGDDLNFKSTYVSLNGRVYSNSAVLLLMKIKGRFEILKTQSFRQTGRTLTATAVDEESRTVVEFDHRPALDAYADALGVSPAEAPAKFFEHPLGLMAGAEPFVRSPQRAEGSRIVFYCQIKHGMELKVLEAADIVADTRKDLAALEAASGAIRGGIEFQCILRTLQLRKEQRCEEYGALFKGRRMSGFSTYGEAYLGHMNQTSTMLLFH